MENGSSLHIILPDSNLDNFTAMIVHRSYMFQNTTKFISAQCVLPYMRNLLFSHITIHLITLINSIYQSEISHGVIVSHWDPSSSQVRALLRAFLLSCTEKMEQTGHKRHRSTRKGRLTDRTSSWFGLRRLYLAQRAVLFWNNDRLVALCIGVLRSSKRALQNRTQKLTQGYSDRSAIGGPAISSESIPSN